jgi:hypothetical protein
MTKKNEEEKKAVQPKRYMKKKCNDLVFDGKKKEIFSQN